MDKKGELTGDYEHLIDIILWVAFFAIAIAGLYILIRRFVF